MAARVSDLSFRHRKIGHARRQDVRRRFNQYGDVEMVLEKVAGFDGSLVAATDENDAATLQLDGRHRRHGFGRRRKQCGHLWPRTASLTGPSGELADIGKLDRACAPAVRPPRGTQNRFLASASRERAAL